MDNQSRNYLQPYSSGLFHDVEETGYWFVFYRGILLIFLTQCSLDEGTALPRNSMREVAQPLDPIIEWAFNGIARTGGLNSRFFPFSFHISTGLHQ